MATIQSARFIQYGRRKSKTTQEKETTAREGLCLPDGTDLRTVKVLRRDEYNRIQNGLYAQRQESLKKRAEEREEKTRRCNESKELVKNWPNTIIGERQMKLQAKQLREEAEEQKRVKIDIEEAKFQAEQRKHAIEQAKTKQYYQSDRVKEFHGALLLTEVIKERELQIELKKAREAVINDPDRFKRMQAQLAEDLAAENERNRLKREERVLLADYQIHQRKEREREEKALRDAELKEGERVRNIGRLYDLEQLELKRNRKSNRNTTRKAYDNHCKEKKAVAQLMKQKEEEEDEEIRIFAEGKRVLQKKKKARENDLKKEGELRRDKMKELVGTIYKNIDDRELLRMNHTVLEREARVEREEAEKKQMRADMRKSIQDYRVETLARFERERIAEQQEAAESLRLRFQADEMVKAEELAKKKEKLRKLTKISRYRVDQINERAENERQNREFDMIADNKVLQAGTLEEKQFMEYAQKVIADAEDQGRNTYPLKKAARAGFGSGRGPVLEKLGVRPSYLTSDAQGIELPSRTGFSTRNMKEHTDGGNAKDAKKRLGFVWNDEITAMK